MKTVKITFNIWGNYVGFIGTQRTFDTAVEYDAKEWLAAQVAAGAKLSTKSHITPADLAAHIARTESA